jgi:HTH-type transcriptional regulator/antitoxin HipB
MIKIQQAVRDAKQLGNAVRRERRRQALLQSDVAEKTTLRQATVSALESGEAGTKLATLFDVLTALGLELVVRPRSKKPPAEIEDLF